MSKDRNDEHGERQDSELAIAICGLTCAVRENTAQRECELATKQDVSNAVSEIVLAIREEAAAADRNILKALLEKAGRLSKRLKTVAKAMTALDAATP